MGEAPGWYHRLRIAAFLGVAPWTLDEVPVVWQHWASIAEEAEANARKGQQQWDDLRAGAKQ